ncbi:MULTISPECIES: nuclear transport factor 2 family protein [unclassified Isoptericola]|uniref:nuclear transport factor 2 family protein n=1 Tax=unclassified Isoptericola TaxID=2623355 RepID=UPI002713638E|nr:MULTISPECIES: nuclear transport factor 2 family protein [unclassified Isoptericola]MDO8143531.1 nuclear transport factor 2 family protein [Isoptericola sp. 178]MDO8147396.1 nuclear transport factor 2 family protein [Isoptericola sp. b515]
MDVTTELMAIERRLARGTGADYAEVLHPDAVVVVPGAVLDKAACVAAMDHSPGWDDVDLGEARLVRSDDTATVVYRFTGRRGGDSYAATLVSTYVAADAGWRMLLHQQTPD